MGYQRWIGRDLFVYLLKLQPQACIPEFSGKVALISSQRAAVPTMLGKAFLKRRCLASSQECWGQVHRTSGGMKDESISATRLNLSNPRDIELVDVTFTLSNPKKSHLQTHPFLRFPAQIMNVFFEDGMFICSKARRYWRRCKTTSGKWTRPTHEMLF